MNPYTIIIPSKWYEHQLYCVEAIRRSGTDAPILVVQDGRVDHKPRNGFRSPYGKVEWIEGRNPFVFARNVNIGIAACETDVLLLNDDALYERGSIDELAIAGQTFEEYGMIAPAIVGLTNDFQNPQPGGCLRSIDRNIPFVGAYFRRSVLDQLCDGAHEGPLDERFVGYGYEDDDACRRLRDLGYLLGIYDGCVFEHGSRPSTFRGKGPASQDLMQHNRHLFDGKWHTTALC